MPTKVIQTKPGFFQQKKRKIIKDIFAKSNIMFKSTFQNYNGTIYEEQIVKLKASLRVENFYVKFCM